MSRPTSSTLDALQAHFRAGSSRQFPAQSINDVVNTGQTSAPGSGQDQQAIGPATTPHHQVGDSAHISQTLQRSGYLDPLLLAEGSGHGQLSSVLPTGITRNDVLGRPTMSRNNLVSIMPKPSSGSEPQGVFATTAWDNQMIAAQKRKVDDALIDPRLSEYSYPAPPSTLDAAPKTPTARSASHKIITMNTGVDNNLVNSGTDALLERQLNLQDKSDEGETEMIQNELSRYEDEDEEDIRRSRRGRRRGRGGRGRGGKRGPRKAAEPTGDIKYRLTMGWNSYVDGRLDEAIAWVNDAIRINGETYRAWSLLTLFLEEKGNHKGSFAARMFACDLQPKNVDGWLHCAEIGIALRDEYPQDAAEFLEKVAGCYSAALRADINNRQARHGRAAISAEKGLLRSAAKDYQYLLEHGEHDVHALRSYAEMSIRLASMRKRNLYKPKSAVDWYHRAFSHARENGVDDLDPLEWQDVNIFAEMLAYIGHTKDALYELKVLARWLLGRSGESFWDDWQDDDREWDIDDTRRKEFEDFREEQYPKSSYGSGLPLDLRTKLAVYRLKLGDLDEAQRHLHHLEPMGSNGEHLLSNEPYLLVDIASALYESDLRAMALRFFEPLLSVPDVLDSAALLAAGRCYLEAGDKRQAEECFGTAIDADESNDEASIDARYELAKMYEAAREEQEAYILVNEAIGLQRAHDEAEDENDMDDMDDYQGSDDDVRSRPGISAAGRERSRKQRASRPLKSTSSRKPVRKPALDENGREVRRPRPRRKVFARTEEVTLEEKRRAEKLAAAWRSIHNARETVASDTELGPSYTFMQAAKELVDDFRSCKGFYSWEKYLIHLGIDEDKQVYVSRNHNLIEMKQRLSHNLNPLGPNAERQLGERTAVSYRGVSFSDWLDLFLEYAVSLAHSEKFQDSYQVCESARDAEVFAKNKEDMFLIHVTWAACALRAGDEETCVAAARFLMRDRQFDSDPFRMFAALCRLCPSPASWYASGPVQKYMLRQIKLMDRALESGGGEDSDEEESKANGGRVYPSKELDVTLLVLYGHILFISNSFTYALNYFLRAYSIDPTNHMILLSVGQCYIHYALKRQSENRQYLLIQGFVFLHRYYDLKVSSADAAERQEAHYNMARSYHAIGIPHLAAEFYRRVLHDIPDDSEPGILGRSDLSQEAAYNLQQICWSGGDLEAVKALSERYLTL
ncbi:hypothetical protein F4777DRAFT_547312 [Nemania sp. FL0916]|nr:hypothetical protein F4777DRAFT_547312 [Nemania sp. FL0916]